MRSKEEIKLRIRMLKELLLDCEGDYTCNAYELEIDALEWVLGTDDLSKTDGDLQ